MAHPTYTRVVPEPEHRKATKAFLQQLARVARREGWREAEALNHWLKAASCALAGQVFRAVGATARWEANEAEYMSVVKACKQPKETMTAFSKMLAIVGLALDNHDQDFLGPIFMELASNAHVGQFFTPVGASKLVAALTFVDLSRGIDEARDDGRNFISAHEPACGVGGMILAANSLIGQHGYDVAREIHWTAVDVDWRCVRATYIQLSLTGASADVVHGNILTLEVFSSLPTLASIKYPKIERKREPEEDPNPDAENGIGGDQSG
jgi:hypothetical protein